MNKNVFGKEIKDVVCFVSVDVFSYFRTIKKRLAGQRFSKNEKMKETSKAVK